MYHTRLEFHPLRQRTKPNGVLTTSSPAFVHAHIDAHTHTHTRTHTQNAARCESGVE